MFFIFMFDHFYWIPFPNFEYGNITTDLPFCLFTTIEQSVAHCSTIHLKDSDLENKAIYSPVKLPISE